MATPAGLGGAAVTSVKPPSEAPQHPGPDPSPASAPTSTLPGSRAEPQSSFSSDPRASVPRGEGGGTWSSFDDGTLAAACNIVDSSLGDITSSSKTTMAPNRVESGTMGSGDPRSASPSEDMEPRGQKRPLHHQQEEDELPQIDLTTATEEERRKYQVLSRRIRNRRHAAETRRRKKESMAAMTAELEQLRRQQRLWVDEKDRERVVANQRRQWMERLRSMLRLRETGNRDPLHWSKCVAPDVTVVQPLTPYRSYNVGCVDTEYCYCEMTGILSLIQESTSLIVAIGAMAKWGLHRVNPPGNSPSAAAGSTGGVGGPHIMAGSAATSHTITSPPCGVQLRHDIDERAVAFRDNGLMCPFQLRTLNLRSLGLTRDVVKRGALLVTFNAQNLIQRVEFSFDVVSCWRQMQHACGSWELVLAPSSVSAATQESKIPRIITEERFPFSVVHVNDSWVELMGYSREEAHGLTLETILGPACRSEPFRNFLQDCAVKCASSIEMPTTTKDGTAMTVFIQLFPLSSEGRDRVATLGMQALPPPDPTSGAIASQCPSSPPVAISGPSYLLFAISPINTQNRPGTSEVVAPQTLPAEIRLAWDQGAAIATANAAPAGPPLASGQNPWSGNSSGTLRLDSLSTPGSVGSHAGVAGSSSVVVGGSSGSGGGGGGNQ